MATSTAESIGTTTLSIPVDHVKQFRICLVIEIENAAEELSQLTCRGNRERADAVGYYHRIIRTGPLLDQLGWAHPGEEEAIEIVGPPDALGAACREAVEIVT